jgi:Arc/MetJ-type ribon-helix-helix transcriptional regulator
MPTLSVKIPEDMKEKIAELSLEGLYQNESEYIRDALRQKIKSDTGLTPEEEKELVKRIKEIENSKVETTSLEQA